VILIVLLATATTVAAKKPVGEAYLGKYKMAQDLTFTWTVTADWSPKWSVYRDDRATLGYWKGLYSCFSCMTESPAGVWTDVLPLLPGYFAEGEGYMICAETAVNDVMQYEAWTFRIGGGPPVRSDVVTICP